MNGMAQEPFAPVIRTVPVDRCDIMNSLVEVIKLVVGLSFDTRDSTVNGSDDLFAG
jgi:hypothetical protein